MSRQLLDHNRFSLTSPRFHCYYRGMRKAKWGVNAYKAEVSGENTSSDPKSGKLESPKKHKTSLNPDFSLEGFIKAGKEPGGYKKTAKFLLLIGKEEASKVLKHFDRDEIEKITREIAVIKNIGKDDISEILEDFNYLKTDGPSLRGGVDTAREILTAALGEENGMKVFNKVLPFQGQKPFSFLEDIEELQMLLVLNKETVPILSIILSFLTPAKASLVVDSLDPERQKELIIRLAKMKKVDPSVVLQIEYTLKERIRVQGEIVTEEIDGKAALANILKHMDVSSEEQILADISEDNPDLTEDLKEMIFTADTVLQIDDISLQKVLRDFDDNEIAIVIKGKNDNFREKILGNLSERRREFVQSESIRIGSMKRSAVDVSTKDFINYLREMADTGKINILRDTERFI